jgi:hypothetical protein
MHANAKDADVAMGGDVPAPSGGNKGKGIPPEDIT